MWKDVMVEEAAPAAVVVVVRSRGGGGDVACLQKEALTGADTKEWQLEQAFSD